MWLRLPLLLLLRGASPAAGSESGYTTPPSPPPPTTPPPGAPPPTLPPPVPPPPEDYTEASNSYEGGICTATTTVTTAEECEVAAGEMPDLTWGGTVEEAAVAIGLPSHVLLDVTPYGCFYDTDADANSYRQVVFNGNAATPAPCKAADPLNDANFNECICKTQSPPPPAPPPLGPHTAIELPEGSADACPETEHTTGATSASECEALAAELGLVTSNTVPVELNSGSYPTGCFTLYISDTQRNLFYNALSPGFANGETTLICKSFADSPPPLPPPSPSAPPNPLQPVSASDEFTNNGGGCAAGLEPTSYQCEKVAVDRGAVWGGEVARNSITHAAPPGCYFDRVVTATLDGTTASTDTYYHNTVGQPTSSTVHCALAVLGVSVPRCICNAAPQLLQKHACGTNSDASGTRIHNGGTLGGAAQWGRPLQWSATGSTAWPNAGDVPTLDVESADYTPERYQNAFLFPASSTNQQGSIAGDFWMLVYGRHATTSGSPPNLYLSSDPLASDANAITMQLLSYTFPPMTIGANQRFYPTVPGDAVATASNGPFLLKDHNGKCVVPFEDTGYAQWTASDSKKLARATCDEDEPAHYWRFECYPQPPPSPPAPPSSPAPLQPVQDVPNTGLGDDGQCLVSLTAEECRVLSEHETPGGVFTVHASGNSRPHGCASQTSQSGPATFTTAWGYMDEPTTTTPCSFPWSCHCGVALPPGAPNPSPLSPPPLPPPLSPGEDPDQQTPFDGTVKDKKGLILSNHMPLACLEHFGDHISWTHNYCLIPDSVEQVWYLNAHHIEFVPSLHGFYVDSQETPGGPISRCYLTSLSRNRVNAGSEWAGSPICDGSRELSAQLARTNALFHENKPKYLHLANEPWFKQQSQMQLEDPVDYSKALVDIIEAARANNLVLVSPTVRKGTGDQGNARWLAEMIVACENRTACDVDMIRVLDLHYYHCDPDKWLGETGIIEATKADLISELQTLTSTRGPYQYA